MERGEVLRSRRGALTDGDRARHDRRHLRARRRRVGGHQQHLARRRRPRGGRVRRRPRPPADRRRRQRPAGAGDRAHPRPQRPHQRRRAAARRASTRRSCCTTPTGCCGTSCGPATRPTAPLDARRGDRGRRPRAAACCTRRATPPAAAASTTPTPASCSPATRCSAAGPGATGRSYSDEPTILRSIRDVLLALPERPSCTPATASRRRSAPSATACWPAPGRSGSTDPPTRRSGKLRACSCRTSCAAPVTSTPTVRPS